MHFDFESNKYMPQIANNVSKKPAIHQTQKIKDETKTENISHENKKESMFQAVKHETTHKQVDRPKHNDKVTALKEQYHKGSETHNNSRKVAHTNKI